MSLTGNTTGLDAFEYARGGEPLPTFAWSADAVPPLHSPSDSRGALAELAESYRRLGFDSGYAKAARDQLEAFVVTAESILREYPATMSGRQNTRQLLYAFVARLEQRLCLFAAAAESQSPHGEDAVEGGLGI